MSEAITPRQRWMGILARSKLADIHTLLAALPALPAHERVRGPEHGTVMVRGRAGGTGGRFNLGEMSVCRASVSVASGYVGHAYVAGSDPRHAELAALLDAMLQDPSTHDWLQEAVIEPLAVKLQSLTQTRARRAEQTRVAFFTLVRPEDAAS